MNMIPKFYETGGFVKPQITQMLELIFIPILFKKLLPYLIFGKYFISHQQMLCTLQ